MRMEHEGGAEDGVRERGGHDQRADEGGNLAEGDQPLGRPQPHVVRAGHPLNSGGVNRGLLPTLRGRGGPGGGGSESVEAART